MQFTIGYGEASCDMTDELGGQPVPAGKIAIVCHLLPIGRRLIVWDRPAGGSGGGVGHLELYVCSVLEMLWIWILEIDYLALERDVWMRY